MRKNYLPVGQCCIRLSLSVIDGSADSVGPADSVGSANAVDDVDANADADAENEEAEDGVEQDENAGAENEGAENTEVGSKADNKKSKGKQKISPTDYDKIVKGFQVGDAVNYIEITATQKYTEAIGRYTEATLVKTLEKKGIGRPSTYSSMIEKVQEKE